MKKLTIVFFILIIIPITSAYSNDNVLKVAKASYVPTIDGQLDLIWRSATVNRMTSYINFDNIVENWFDLYASFRILWEPNDLYIYISVMDDEYDVSSIDQTNNDSVEILFKDEQETQIRIELEGTHVVNAPNSVVAYQKTDYGYDIECQIPASDCLVDLTLHHIFGFNLKIFDADEQNGEIDHLLLWTEMEDKNHVGSAQLIEYIVSDTLNIERTHFSPLVDGVLDDDWLNVHAINPNLYIEEGVTEEFIQQKDWNDNWFSCNSLWDENYFYIFFEGYDDELKTSNSAAWLNDACELYFDGDNSKIIGDNHSSFDSNDFQLRIEIDGTLSGDNNRLQPHEYGFKETDEGWNMEFSFKMEDIGITPENNHLIGFDVQKSDNDDTDRSSIVRWWAAGHDSWKNASLFGTAKLVDQQASMVSENKNNAKSISFNLVQNYPNPFNPITRIDYQIPANTTASLKIFNLQGEEITTLINGYQEKGFHFIMWDASHYQTGVYFCKLTAGAHRETKKMLLIK